jgi:hypothetical protein
MDLYKPIDAAELTSERVVALSTDLLASLADRVALDLTVSQAEASRSPAFLRRVENILFCATGQRLHIEWRGE